jgi:uncharacterized membrane protein YgaE (UPF0421/DUF939 family)
MGDRVRQAWRRLAGAVNWTPPSSTEVGSVAKAGLAAGLAWWLATAVTDEPNPVLASFTAVVVVQVSVGSSIRTALERTVAVVLGVVLALAIGDALELNAIVVAVLVAGSLAFAELLLRLPRAAARQVPLSVLAVLSTLTLTPRATAGTRMVDTLLGGIVGIAISFGLPVSRARQAREVFSRLGDGLSASLKEMASGLQEPWSTEQTENWRRNARTVRERLTRDAEDAIDPGGDPVRWNIRDRPHKQLLERLQSALPRFQRAAIGVSVISRGLDDHARLTGTSHPAMPSMGLLLGSLAEAIESLGRVVLTEHGDDDFSKAVVNVNAHRARCVDAASRRARAAAEGGNSGGLEELEGEWLNYTALLVQVDRIVADLTAPLPT